MSRLRGPSVARRGGAALAALLLAAGAVWAPTSAAAQSAPGWRFEDDAFADLWFHGLAVVGFYGFGPMPLYDPAYANAVRGARRAAGQGSTPLERDGGDLLGRFRGDDAFEAFHFVPLYLQGADRAQALSTLAAVAAAERGTPDVPPDVLLGASIVSGLLPDAGERRTLGVFVRDLDDEWREVVSPRRTRDHQAWTRRLDDVRRAWDGRWAPPLAAFLEAEGFTSGTVVAVPALGAEGRFLERNPGGRPGPLVVVGLPAGDDGPAAALSSLVRELCYPAVRRAFASFEARFADRIAASRASDLTATRCGELLLEKRAPAQVPAYRARFGLPPEGSGRAFLSATGTVPGAAAWEGDLNDALLRELNLEPDGARLPAAPVGRR